ncbi:MAG: prepilin-type N-terminal cleavage/methylation domain-containing protein [bacterium]
MRHRTGFTLIELLIVVAIIAILAAIAVPNFLEAQTRSKVSRGRADMRTIATAVESYWADHSKYPPTQASQESRYAYVTSPVAYISSIPADVFGSGRLGTWTFAGYLSYYTYDFIVAYAPDKLWGFGPAYWPAIMKGAQVTAPESKGWYLASAGPDRRAGLDSSANREFMATPYDPTNGSISPGDIQRIGP